MTTLAERIATLDDVGRQLTEAAEMLGRLAGRTHEVLTGVSILRGGTVARCRFVESTHVSFRPWMPPQ